MIQSIKKLDDHTISFERVSPPEVKTETRNYTMLVEQRKDLLAEKAAFNERIDSRLNEINNLIAQADILGVK